MKARIPAIIPFARTWFLSRAPVFSKISLYFDFALDLYLESKLEEKKKNKRGMAKPIPPVPKIIAPKRKAAAAPSEVRSLNL